MAFNAPSSDPVSGQLCLPPEPPEQRAGTAATAPTQAGGIAIAVTLALIDRVSPDRPNTVRFVSTARAKI